MSGSSGPVIEPLRKPVSCPSCGQNSTRSYYPFCSKRCQDLDLHKWFSGSYAIAATDQSEGFEET
ncbi:MAG: DNA gyrase inhibitor YacG [Pseudomonadota bacterium]